MTRCHRRATDGQGPEDHSLVYLTAAQQTGHPARSPRCAGALCPHQASCGRPQCGGKKLFPGTISKQDGGPTCWLLYPNPQWRLSKAAGWPSEPLALGSPSRAQFRGQGALCRHSTSPAPARPSQTPRVTGTPRPFQPTCLTRRQLVQRSEARVGGKPEEGRAQRGSSPGARQGRQIERKHPAQGPGVTGTHRVWGPPPASSPSGVSRKGQRRKNIGVCRMS